MLRSIEQESAMARFPVIQSPCPYKDNLSAILDGDACRMCKRQVHDLSAMSDEGRVAFFAGCNGAEVCVKYEVRMPKGLARIAMGAAVAAMPLPLAAQEASAAPQEVEAYEDMEIFVGGIKNTRSVDYIDSETDLKTPELPVIVEEPVQKTLKTGVPTG
jgi:hypothetical protein